MRGNKLIFFLLFLCFFIVSGCGSGAKRAVDPPEIKKQTKAESVDIDVYIDGTVSMGGFVNFPDSTVYVNSLKAIEQAAASAWKKENINYVKFGDKFTALNRASFNDVVSPAFYNESSTRLDQTFEQADVNKLNVIITDLFQTDQDVNSIMLLLKRKFLVNDKAIAIIGIKSQFDGTVYDVGKTKASFEYKSGDNKESYRPFYFVITGNIDEVNCLITALNKTFPKDIEHKTVIFEKNLGEEAVISVDTKNKLKGTDNPLPRITNLLPKNNEVLQYKLKDQDAKANLLFEAEINSSDIPKEYVVNSKNIELWTGSKQETDIKTDTVSDSYILGIKKVLGFSKNTNATEGAFVKVSAKNFISGQITECKKEEGKFLAFVGLDVSPKKLPEQKGVYRVNMELVPSLNSYVSAKDVFADWDMDPNGVLNKNAERLPGNTTLNISSFVEMLARVSYETLEPRFHNIYIYFER